MLKTGPILGEQYSGTGQIGPDTNIVQDTNTSILLKLVCGWGKIGVKAQITTAGAGNLEANIINVWFLII